MSTGTIRTLTPGVIDLIDPPSLNNSSTIAFAETITDPQITVGSPVSFTIDLSGREPLAIQIQLSVADPEFPVNSDYPGADIKTTPQADLIFSGSTVIIDGTTVNGNITFTNGTLVIRSTDSTGSQKSTVNGNIEGRLGSTLVLYKSDVNGNIDINESQDMKINGGGITGDVQFRSSNNATINGGTITGDVQLKNSNDVKNNGSITGDVQLKENKKATNGGTITGDVQIKNNETTAVESADPANPVKISGNLIVKDNTVKTTLTNVKAGNVDVKNNTGCSYNNVTVNAGGSLKISGCTLIP